MPDHIADREIVIQALRDELVGPSPQGEPIDCSGQIAFAERLSSRTGLGHNRIRVRKSSSEIHQQRGMVSLCYTQRVQVMTP